MASGMGELRMNGDWQRQPHNNMPPAAVLPRPEAAAEMGAFFGRKFVPCKLPGAGDGVRSGGHS